MKLFAVNEGNLEASLKLLDENILNYKDIRNKILESLSDKRMAI